jgi:hypothetical protein
VKHWTTSLTIHIKQLVTVLLDLADKTIPVNWVDWHAGLIHVQILTIVQLLKSSLKTVSFQFATQVENFEHNYERQCWAQKYVKTT